ncbi:MAG TPA: hypothetical protein VGW38_09270 [Chloroflexota bacterium]|nr:hypothetical protein [Chloroflexota bacterium]
MRNNEHPILHDEVDHLLREGLRRQREAEQAQAKQDNGDWLADSRARRTQYHNA